MGHYAFAARLLAVCENLSFLEENVFASVNC